MVADFSAAVVIADAGMIEPVKILADAHRHVFGFIPRAAFVDAVEELALLVALVDGRVVGFLRFHHRQRDTQTTLYDICVEPALRGRGIGRLLLGALYHECLAARHDRVSLKCPADLPANGFYERLGFTPVALLEGKRRPLMHWYRPLEWERRDD